jgi:hypothetical protein
VLVLGGILVYRQLRDAKPVFDSVPAAEQKSNRKRLVGAWVADLGANGENVLDFRSDGQLYVTIDSPRDNPVHEEQRGTWEVLSESGDRVRVRLKTRSSTGDNHDNTKDITFQGDDAFTVSDRTETWHRRASIWMRP